MQVKQLLVALINQTRKLNDIFYCPVKMMQGYVSVKPRTNKCYTYFFIPYEANRNVSLFVQDFNEGRGDSPNRVRSVDWSLQKMVMQVTNTH